MERINWWVLIEHETSIFASLWRFKWYIAAVVVAAGLVGYGVSLLQPTLYEAQGEVLLEDPSNMEFFSQEVGLSPDSKRHVAEQARLIKSVEVTQRASEMLGGTPSGTDIEDSMSVVPSSNSDAIAIYASQATPNEAVALVDALEQAYAEVVEEEIGARVDASVALLEETKAGLEVDLEGITAALDASISDANAGGADTSSEDSTDQQDGLVAGIIGAAGPALARMGVDADLAFQQETLLNRVAGFDSRLQTLAVGRTLYGSGIKLYLEPPLPRSPTQPRPARNAAIAAVLGLIGAGAWAWWRAESNRLADDDAHGEPPDTPPS